MVQPIWLQRSLVLVAALLTLGGIGMFGIWDPWELEPNRASGLLFEVFGIGEISARLPNALAGLFACAFAYLMLARVKRPRAGALAVAVLASTPLFLLNARLGMGDAVGMAAQAWVGLAALAASVPGVATRRKLLHLGSLGTAIGASTATSGVLLGPLPPVVAVAALLAIDEGAERSRPWVRWLLGALVAIAIAGVVRATLADAPAYSVWLGGGAVGGEPPTWDKAIELVFHGFAPWSAALPVAFAWAMWPTADRAPAAQRLGWALVLWLAIAFVSWTFFASRYGTPPLLASVPLAALVALWLDEASAAKGRSSASAVVIALLTGLLFRDYALYPDRPLRTLAADTLSMPEVYRPTLGWALVFTLAALPLCTMLVSKGSRRPDTRRTAHWVRDQWNAPWPGRGWMMLAVSLLGACVAFGLMCFAIDLPIASIVIRGGRIALFAPLAIAALMFGLPWLPYAYGRLGSLRLLPMLGSALVVGGFIAWSFIPSLSKHFSPKPAYETYAELSGQAEEPLAIYRVGAGAARYYTDTPVVELEEPEELLTFLGRPGQRWAVIGSDQLAKLDAKYRRATGRHLYVADARSANLLLLAGTPIAKRANQSFIVETLMPEGFTPEHAIEANFGGRIALIGYDLDLPGGQSVGAGQRFKVTWYWRVIGKPPRGHQVFVHIDGNGLRLNGDHKPVGGRYPAANWQAGDIIADSQELLVPANFQADDYVMYVGWFSGKERLQAKSGPNDGVNRVRAGVLPVR